MLHRLRLIAAITVTAAALIIPIHPSLAAEEVSITVDSEELFNIPMTVLEGYASTGEASGDLETILALIPEELKPQFQDALNYKLKVKPQPFSQFLTSNLGNLVLKADIHQLYQKLLKLRDQAKQVVQQSGIKVEVSQP